MLNINELSVGRTVKINDDVFVIVNLEHVKPGKGSAFVRTKLKNLKTGSLMDITFKDGDKIEPAYVEERTLTYLYNSGDMYYFMDQTSFEEVMVPAEVLGDQVLKFLKENLDVRASFYEGQIVSISLPNFIVYEVVETAPGVRGDTVKNALKPATLENGTVVQVPLFVETGDKIKIDTRTGKYIERV